MGDILNDAGELSLSALRAMQRQSEASARPFGTSGLRPDGVGIDIVRGPFGTEHRITFPPTMFFARICGSGFPITTTLAIDLQPSANTIRVTLPIVVDGVDASGDPTTTPAVLPTTPFMVTVGQETMQVNDTSDPGGNWPVSRFQTTSATETLLSGTVVTLYGTKPYCWVRLDYLAPGVASTQDAPASGIVSGAIISSALVPVLQDIYGASNFVTTTANGISTTVYTGPTVFPAFEINNEAINDSGNTIVEMWPTPSLDFFLFSMPGTIPIWAQLLRGGASVTSTFTTLLTDLPYGSSDAHVTTPPPGAFPSTGGFLQTSANGYALIQSMPDNGDGSSTFHLLREAAGSDDSLEAVTAGTPMHLAVGSAFSDWREMTQIQPGSFVPKVGGRGSVGGGSGDLTGALQPAYAPAPMPLPVDANGDIIGFVIVRLWPGLTPWKKYWLIDWQMPASRYQPGLVIGGLDDIASTQHFPAGAYAADGFVIRNHRAGSAPSNLFFRISSINDTSQLDVSAAAPGVSGTGPIGSDGAPIFSYIVSFGTLGIRANFVFAATFAGSDSSAHTIYGLTTPDLINPDSPNKPSDYVDVDSIAVASGVVVGIRNGGGAGSFSGTI